MTAGNKKSEGLLPAIFALAVIVAAVYGSKYPDLLTLPEAADYIYRTLLAKLLFVAVLFLAAYGAGGLFFARRAPAFHDMLEEFVFKSGLGIIVISYGVFLLGIAGLLYPAAGYALLGACLAVGWKAIPDFLKRAAGTRPELKLDIPSVLLLVTAGYFLWNGFERSLLPTNGFDPLMYHLGVPRLYIDAHKIFPTPDISGSSFPFGAEMIFLLAMLVEGQITANVVNLSFAVMAGLAVVVFVRRFAPGVSRLFAFTVFVSVPLVIWLMPQPYSEFPLAFYSMLSMHALIAAFTAKDRGWIPTAALMAGFTMALKYTGILFVGVMALGILVQYLLIERLGPKKAAAPAGLFLAAAALVSMPWYIRNIVFYNNPIFPFMAGYFNHVTAANANVESYGNYWQGGAVGVAYKFVSSFWRTTFDAAAMKAAYNTALGPYFLMFIPGLLLFRGMGRGMKYLMAFTFALFAAFYVVTQDNIRYLFPVIPALAVLAAYPAGTLINEKPFYKRSIGISMVAVFMLSALLANKPRMEAAENPAYNPDAEDRFYSEDLMSGYTVSYDAWKWIDANLPRDAVVYQLWDDATVYFRHRKTIGSTLPWGGTGRQKIHNIAGYNNFASFLPGEEIIGNLKAMGAEYILINTNREGHCVPEDPYFKAHTRLVFSKYNVFLYQVVP